jgi:hypothetical protein
MLIIELGFLRSLADSNCILVRLVGARAHWNAAWANQLTNNHSGRSTYVSRIQKFVLEKKMTASMKYIAFFCIDLYNGATRDTRGRHRCVCELSHDVTVATAHGGCRVLSPGATVLNLVGTRHTQIGWFGPGYSCDASATCDTIATFVHYRGTRKHTVPTAPQF